MPRRNGLSEAEIRERWERVADLTRRGVSAADIAHQLEITERTVFRARAKMLVAKPAPKRFTADELSLIETMLEDGASFHEIGRTLGRHWSTISKRFPGRGWTQRQAAEWGALMYETQRRGLLNT